MPPATKLILLVNLGSPAELSVRAIRKFLRQFLSDRRVVALSRIVWYPILYGIILPLRAKKLLAKYRKIWLKQHACSPLLHYTRLQAEKLQELSSAEDCVVDYAFCYGERTIAERLSLHSTNPALTQLLVIPLYPQYSSSTTAAVFDQLAAFYARRYFIQRIKFINSFAEHPLYIAALAAQVAAHWAHQGRKALLIVSFHSIPVKLTQNGDWYIAECRQTYQLLCASLKIRPEVDAKLVFQSKFGKAEWEGPATNQVLASLAKSGVASVDVLCPGFVSDCLETLEEVAIDYRQLFIANGGSELNYIPCLNASVELASLLQALSSD